MTPEEEKIKAALGLHSDAYTCAHTQTQRGTIKLLYPVCSD